MDTQLAFMNRRGRSGSGKRKIVVFNLDTDVEAVIVERKGFHLYEPDWLRDFCGNGTVVGAEQCDDGNNANNDGCSAICMLE